MEQPDISVVVPAYNEERLLPHCLRSLTSQKGDFPYEIIVVDNASTDGTARVARWFGARVVREPTKGVGAARRTGFEAARAAIIASTDADCIVPPDWLPRLRDILAQNPHLAAVGGYVFFHDALPYYNFLPRLTHSLNAFRLAGRLVGRQPLSTQNLAVRREAYTRAGGFNPDITSPLGLDDVDFTLRLSAVGEVAVWPDLVVWASARRYVKEPVRTTYYRWANYVSYVFRGRGSFAHETSDVRL